jgi:hypothetical protein
MVNRQNVPGDSKGKGVQMDSLSRRRLLVSAGAATGTAAIAAAPAVAAAALEHGEVTDPSGPPPEEAVIAYVRDPKRGEVTVMSGTRELTYRDPALVKRLLKAAPGNH